MSVSICYAQKTERMIFAFSWWRINKIEKNEINDYDKFIFIMVLNLSSSRFFSLFFVSIVHKQISAAISTLKALLHWATQICLRRLIWGSDTLLQRLVYSWAFTLHLLLSRQCFAYLPRRWTIVAVLCCVSLLPTLRKKRKSRNVWCQPWLERRPRNELAM